MQREEVQCIGVMAAGQSGNSLGAAFSSEGFCQVLHFPLQAKNAWDASLHLCVT